MNTGKQVFVMAVLVLASLVVLGVYGAWLPSREKAAEATFDERTAERGAIIFAQNCRLCHGDVGEGGALGARLPASPALNRPDLQGFIDSKAMLAADVKAADLSVKADDVTSFKAGQTILVDEERMNVTEVSGLFLTVKRGAGHTAATTHSSGTAVQILDAVSLKEKVTLITNTLTCGRVGTAMQPWAQSQGGPLGDEQIRQLMILIVNGGWDMVPPENNHLDALGTKLLGGLDPDAVIMRVSNVTVFKEGEAIRIGEERLRVVAVPKVGQNEKDKSGVVRVERGVLGTTPLDLAAGTPIFKFPETAEPSINQQSCGQTAKAPAPAGTPTLVEPFEGQTVEIVAKNIQFDLKEIRVKAGGKVRIRLDNQDVDVLHNVAVYMSATDLMPAASGSVGLTFKGPNKDDTVFDVPPPGTYYFRCDVHPTIMTGRFIVEP